MKPIFAAILLLVPPLAGAKPKVSFLADHVAADTGKVVVNVRKKASVPFELPVAKLSPPLEVSDREFELRPSGGGEALATITLPDRGQDFVVFLTTTATGYAAAIIETGGRKFRAGDVYFHNGSGETIVGSVGGAELEVEPGAGQYVRPKPGRSATAYEIAISVREASGDKPLSNTRWPVEEGLRTYVLFYTNPDTGRISFRTAEEFVGDR